jgi:hypothetical protein
MPSLPGEIVHEDANRRLENRIAGDTASAGRLQDGRPAVGHARPAVLVAVFVAVVLAFVVAVVALFLTVVLGWRQPRQLIAVGIGPERKPGFSPGESVPAAGPERLRGRQPVQCTR